MSKQLLIATQRLTTPEALPQVLFQMYQTRRATTQGDLS
jgi:hypothetical protein